MHGTPQSKTAVRLVFAVVALGCVIQYYLSTRLGEPYPSLRMPGFAGAGGYQDGKVHIRRLEAVFVTADGEAVSFSQRDLLSDFPATSDHYCDRQATARIAPLAGRSCRNPGGRGDRWWLSRPTGLRNFAPAPSDRVVGREAGCPQNGHA
jgi:hypothetical protein